MSDETGDLPTRRDERPPDLRVLVDLVSKALELETTRVAVSTKEAEIAAEALKVADADNERQYHFHSNRFEKQHGHQTERWRAKNKKQWVLIGAAIGLPVAILTFLFFGSPGQQQQALQVIGHAMSFGAGVGFGYFLGARGGKDTD
ncbi:MAG: hypothetical protein OXQ94_04640 [Gemmatimonadota bacterium]|nr:hypothetical protein [Gemmatimonadota bacterium]MDE2870961.1 hypothetical protein [Gemmatimonadota bacterium]